MTSKPPLHIWFAAAMVSCIRSLPFWIAISRSSIPGGTSYLPLGYIPKDWLQYVAFIHQSATTGNWLLTNPYTTEPQSGHFVLLFHQLLGGIHAGTGISGFWLLELSRFPLTLLFFWVLWRFLIPILPDYRHRSWACWMVAFSGGLDFLLLSVSNFLPGVWGGVIQQNLWHLQGWNTFQAFYNPLWIVALTLMLWILQPILQTGGPVAIKDKLVVGLGVIVLWFTHPYSAIVVFTICAVYFFLTWCLDMSLDWQSLRHTAVTLLPIIVIIAVIHIWQRQDPVFRACSGGVFGTQSLSVFWYPITFGGVGFFALRGWRNFLELKHPWRFGIAGWTLAVIFLHSSPILNGYHFILYLHLPLCIAAAQPVTTYFDSICSAKHRNYMIGFLFFLLFSSSLSTTANSLKDLNYYRIPTSFLELCNHLKGYPPGNVLAPPGLGNIIPALTPHRVFVGHWFMTPNYRERVLRYQRLTENPEEYEADLKKLLVTEQINYLVVLKQFSEKIESILNGRIKGRAVLGPLTVINLKDLGTHKLEEGTR